jgi:ATP-dependent Clp protease protease subunit
MTKRTLNFTMISLCAALIAGPIMLLALLAPEAKSQPAPVLLPRDVYVNGPIDDNLAALLHMQLKKLNEESHDEITMHITSGGGGVYSGLQIYDDMAESPSKIRTVCEGYCMSMAAVLLTGGDIREASENTTIMFHQVAFGIERAKLSEAIDTVNEGARLQDVMDSIIMEHSGLTKEQVQKLESYDHFMSGKEAKALNLVDLVKPRKKK